MADHKSSQKSLNKDVEMQERGSRAEEPELAALEVDSLQEIKVDDREPTPEETMNFVDRDPENIQESVKVNFADIIAEPSGAHSFRTVWGTSFKVYSLTKYWIYRVMSLIFGIPLSLIWGIYFSLLAFISIWLVTPTIRALLIQVGFVGRVWGVCVSTVLDPFFESIGLILSRVRVALTVRKETMEVIEDTQEA